MARKIDREQQILRDGCKQILLETLPVLAARMHGELESVDAKGWPNGNLAFSAKIAEMIAHYGFGKPGQQLPTQEDPEEDVLDLVTDDKIESIRKLLDVMGYAMVAKEPEPQGEAPGSSPTSSSPPSDTHE